MPENYLKQHLAACKKAANEVEKRICETPNMPAKELVKAIKEMDEYIGAMGYLSRMDAVVNPPAIVQPSTPVLSITQ